MSVKIPSAELVNTIARTRLFAAASRSAATRKAYASDIRDFKAYCFAIGADALPAEAAVVATYLAHLAESKSTAMGSAGDGNVLKHLPRAGKIDHDRSVRQQERHRNAALRRMQLHDRCRSARCKCVALEASVKESQRCRAL
jgi:site-specific recombinase XerD